MPTQDEILECYETATFNDTTCVWDITGTQPTQDEILECYEIATFNDATCVWDITGEQDAAPSTTCETTFNNVTCERDIGDCPACETSQDCIDTNPAAAVCQQRECQDP